MRKRTFAATSGLLLVSTLLSACGAAPDRDNGVDQGKYDSSIKLDKNYDPQGHINWGFTVYPASWDPTKSVSGGDLTSYEPVYDRLLYEDPDGKVHPMLATEFAASDDNKTLTLKLRQGLTFADGTPFNAEAVKFNLDRTRASHSNLAGELAQIASVEVIDGGQVAIHVTGRIGSLPIALAARSGVMVSPAAAQSGALESGPVGIGPYHVTKIEPGTRIDYAKNPGYWDPEAQHTATRSYLYIPDDQSRLNALMSGELDGAVTNATDFDKLAAKGFINIVRPSALGLFVAVNSAKAPFNDPRVRKALNLAVDREAISEGLYDGYCTPQIQPFPVGSPGYNAKLGDGLDTFPYDVAAAKQTLKEAGVSELTMSIATPTVTSLSKFAEAVQAQFADVGIKASVTSAPPKEIQEKFAVNKTVDAVVSIMTTNNDPDAVNSTYLSPNARLNPGGTKFEELIALGAEGAASLDPQERKPAYEKYMNAWVETPPHMIPVCMVHLPSAYHAKVSGVSQRASGLTNMREVAVSAD